MMKTNSTNNEVVATQGNEVTKSIKWIMKVAIMRVSYMMEATTKVDLMVT